MEVEKNCGFITYDKVSHSLGACNVSQVESTERAIAEVNGSLVGGVQLKVNRLVYNVSTIIRCLWRAGSLSLIPSMTPPAGKNLYLTSCLQNFVFCPPF